MTQLLSKNPLVKMIANGEADSDMIKMLLQKHLPFTEMDYLEALVFIIKIPEHKQQAIDKLKEISDGTKKNYVENSSANKSVSYYILLEALSLYKNDILIKITQNNYFPEDFLKKIAEKGNTEMLETLSENQIKLIAYPEIIDIMEKNPNLNNFTKGKLDEIRHFYLKDEKAEEIKMDSLTDDIFSIAAEEMKEKVQPDKESKNEAEEQKEVEKKPEIVEEEDEDEELPIEEVEQQVMARFQEINNMSVAERVKTALLGNQADRAMLIRDPNKMISFAVIESPKITIEEVCSIIKNKSIAGEIITKIAKKKAWTKNYQVQLELVINPKTPVSHAMGFLKKLHANDLKLIRKDKNVNPVIRKFAQQIQDQKG